MKTSRDYGREYAKFLRTEGLADGPVDINKELGATCDIPPDDYRHMRDNGIEPDAREYWQGYNSIFEEA